MFRSTPLLLRTRLLAARRMPLLLLAALLLGGIAAAPAHALPLEDVEVTGPIEELTDSTVTVQGQTFLVTAATTIQDDDDRPIPFSSLTLGLLVEAEGDYRLDGTLVARKIEIEDEGNGGGGGDDGEVETEGPILALTDSSLTVGGVTFGVTARTSVQPATLTFADLALGQRVRVRGSLAADGSAVAERIKARTGQGGGGDDDHEVEIEGLVETLTDSSLTVRGQTFALTAQTVVHGHNHQPLPQSALAVGQLVEVKGVYRAGALVAVRVEIEDLHEGEVELRGTIDSLRTDGLTVAGTDFAVTDQTIVLDNDRQPIAFADLAVGMLVEIRGVAGADGRTVATRIKLEDGVDDEIELRATLDQVSDSLVVALGRAFVVGPGTQVFGPGRTPVPFSALAARQLVELRARRAFDGTLLAMRIEQEDGNPASVRLQAAITAVDADSLDVLDVRFAADGATVTLADGTAGTLADLAVGQSVEVTGLREATGLRATAIRVRRAARAAGLVTSAPGAGFAPTSAFAISGVEVAFTDATLIVDATGAALSAAALTPGSTVRVAGTTPGAGRLDATVIEVIASAGIVAAEDAPETVFATLERVYPNPTAGAATLRFTLPEAAPVAVEIVDVLGRTVRAIAPAEHGVGTHNALLPTEGLPAGRYLVRLQVGGRSTTAQTITVLR